MIIASYQLSNAWHGLGTVGHVVLGILVVVILVVFVVAALRR